MTRKYKKKTPRQKLILKLDDVCRQIIRLRDGYICQWCNNDIRESAHHAHHIIKRQHKRTRWDLNNLILLCFTCHQKFHEGVWGKDWFTGKFSDRWAYLNGIVAAKGGAMPRCHLIWKPTVNDLEELLKTLKQKLREFQNDRPQ